MAKSNKKKRAVRTKRRNTKELNASHDALEANSRNKAKTDLLQKAKRYVEAKNRPRVKPAVEALER